MLSVDHLTKRFGGVAAVNDCSFTVRSHAITALIGPNGAGKSTVFACVSGFSTPDSGSIRLGRTDLLRAPPAARARAGISRTFQHVRTFPYLTVEEQLLIAVHRSDDRVPAMLGWDTRASRLRVRNAIERVGLPRDILRRYGSDCSYGQAKLVELARALLFPHTLLMLDEPVAGVNPILRTQIVDVLRQLRADGETILLIEHDMEFVRSLADHVIVMAEGAVLLDGTPNEVLSHPDVLEVYLGMARVEPPGSPAGPLPPPRSHREATSRASEQSSTARASTPPGSTSGSSPRGAR